MATTPATMPEARVGRRERNKAEKRDRIFDAADALFSEHGYDAVTTGQIADAADVGAGTLFRYFPTKADLFIEVMSTRLRSGIARARKLSAAGEDAATAILALVEPLIVAGARHPENTVAFQREVLFGAHEQDDRYRDVVETETAIADILLRTRADTDPERARDLARIIYATVYVDLIRAAQPSLGKRASSKTRATIARHVRLVLASP